MGADIYTVVEIDEFRRDFSMPIGLAYMEWPRFTDLFLAMGLYSPSDNCQVPYRGLPSPCSHLTLGHYGMYVRPDDELAEWYDEIVIGETDALEAIERGDSHWINSEPKGLYDLSNPIYSYPNWVTLHELAPVCQRIPKTSERQISTECNATLALMREMAAKDIPVRLVYWFNY